MLMVISPAKTLDYATPPITTRYTIPDFLDDAAILADQLRSMEPDAIAGFQFRSRQIGQVRLFELNQTDMTN